VTFLLNDGTTDVFDTQVVASPGGGVVTAPDPDPTRVGYTFDGWFTDTEGTTAVDFDDVITADTTYYASWTMT